jgi:MSHA biogenesis protein MshL
VNWNVLTLIAPIVLVGCSSMYPSPDLSTQDRISDELTRMAVRSPAKEKTSAMSTSVLDALMQSPSSAAGMAHKPIRTTSDQRFDLVVTDAPIGQVLAGLVEGTEYSIMLKPSTQSSPEPVLAGSGIKMEPVDVSSKRVSFKLKNITLFDALDAIRDVYGYDYTIENRRILVQPAEVQTRLYYVNYILGQRRGVSDIQVIGGASVGQSSSSSTASSSTSSSSYGSVQASGMSTTVKSDIWSEVEDALRTLLGCNVAKVGAVNPMAVRPAGSGSTQGNSSRADVNYPGEPAMGERLRGVDGCTQGRAMIINAMSGTILVRGMPTELRMVERMLKTMQLNIARQVVIESKIIDVELSKDAQQGINWGLFKDGLHRASVGANPSALGVNQPSAFAGQSGGTVASGTTLAGLLGTNMSPPGGTGNTAGIAIQATNFSALINFMESQGRVHVLSSPRISTLNNQKAVIKVGSEEPFVTNIIGGSQSLAVGTSTVVNPSLTYQPFFSGIALDVTPQIDAEDNITLHVHSMVNRVVEKSKIALIGAGNTATVPFAVNTMNETDSVVKARDGQVVVIGGLMSERNSDVRGGVPGARDVPLAGALFNWGAQQFTKRELVILLKATVVKDDGTWSDLISDSQERISGLKTTPR